MKGRYDVLFLSLQSIIQFNRLCRPFDFDLDPMRRDMFQDFLRHAHDTRISRSYNKDVRMLVQGFGDIVRLKAVPFLPPL